MPKRLRVVADSDEEHVDANSPEAGNSSGDEPTTSSRKKDSSERQQKKTQPTSKKSKLEAHEKTTKGAIHINSDGDTYIDLGKKRRAVVRSFKGTPLLDIREYYGTEGEEKPGKKGISLQLEQWQNLQEASSIIDELFQKVKK